MKKKLLVLGIDSMDRHLVNEYIDRLPNIKRMMERGFAFDSEGVFPPDSPTSWASIYTGKNPARHGILFFVDPLDKTGHLLREEIANTNIKGATFWDVLGKTGYRLFVAFPLLGYPTWKINGAMISRATTKSEVQMNPQTMSKDELMELDGLRGLPHKDRDEFIARGKRVIEREKQFVLKNIKDGQWDMLFFYSSILDPMQHHFWSCYDSRDPTYVKGNPYENVIIDFYQLYDKVVGEMVDAVGDDTYVILLSDHGHMMRPRSVVNVNKILMEMGLLKIKKSKKTIKSFIYKRKAWIFETILDRRLGDLAMQLLKVLPAAKSVFTMPDNIDWDNTVAHVSDLSGIKAYTYGGIVIRKENLKGLDYSKVRDDIIKALVELKHPDTGEKLVKWISKREDMYSGEYIGRYPDIVFKFHDEYGSGWSLDEALISVSTAHNINPGSHRQDSAVLVICNCSEFEPVSKNAMLMDFAPTVFKLLDIDTTGMDFDGKSLLRRKK